MKTSLFSQSPELLIHIPNHSGVLFSDTNEIKARAISHYIDISTHICDKPNSFMLFNLEKAVKFLKMIVGYVLRTGSASSKSTRMQIMDFGHEMLYRWCIKCTLPFATNISSSQQVTFVLLVDGWPLAV